MTRTAWPAWMLVVYAGVVIGLVLGTAQALGTSRPLSGLIGAVVFGSLAAIVVGLGLRQTARTAPPDRADRLRRSLPLGLLVGALAGGLVMGVLTWLLDQA